MANFAHLSYTPAQVYVDVLAFAQGKTLEDLIPDDQVAIEFRPPRKGEWYLRPFGVPGIAEIDIDEPRLILIDKPKQRVTLRPQSAQILLEALAIGFCLQEIILAHPGEFTRDEAAAYLEALAAKEEAQCAKK